NSASSCRACSPMSAFDPKRTSRNQLTCALDFWTLVLFHHLCCTKNAAPIAICWNYMSNDTLRYRRRGTGGMSGRDEYLLRAADLLAKAGAEVNGAFKDRLENMARSYLRLAEQAKRNAQSDTGYERQPKREGEQP